MYISTQTFTEQEAEKTITEFVTQHPTAHYYLENVTVYELNAIHHLKIDTDFLTLRLFTETNELYFRKLSTGIQGVILQQQPTDNAVLLKNSAQRSVLIDNNYVQPYHTLFIDLYEHESFGRFEHWKGVQ